MGVTGNHSPPIESCPSSCTHRVRPIESCSSSHAHRVMLTESCSSSHAHRVMFIESCPSSHAHRVMLIESCPSSHAHRVIPRLVSTHASAACEFLTCILHEYAHKANTVCIIVIHVQRQELSVFFAYKGREFSQISGIRLHMSSCGGNQKSFAALAARVLTREEPGVAGFEGRARRGGFHV